MCSTVVVKAIGVWCSTYSVHVCGEGGVMLTSKLVQVNPVFAWEMLLTLWVCDNVVPNIVLRGRWKFCTFILFSPELN